MVGSVGSAKDAASLGASVSTITIREEAILEPLVQEPGLSHLGARSLQAHMTNGHLAGHDRGTNVTIEPGTQVGIKTRRQRP